MQKSKQTMQYCIKLPTCILAVTVGLLAGCSTDADNNSTTTDNSKVVPTTPTAKSTSMPDWRKNRNIQNANYVNYKDEYDIVRDTKALGGIPAKYYQKYIDYTASNGKPIRILAQSEFTDAQILYSYSITSVLS